MTSLGEVDEKDILTPDDLTDLYSWIDNAPLTRTKKHISRDFSDGVSVAEIVHFYMPRLIELHNYVNANSSAQKKINWNMLNRKVFVKLNLKLSDKTLDNIIEAKSGAIEQVLWDLRKKVIEQNPKCMTSKILKTGTSGQLRTNASSTAYSDSKLGKRSHSPARPTSSRIPTKSQINQFPSSPSSPKKAAFVSSLLPSKNIAQKKSQEGTSSYSDGLKDELSQYGNHIGANQPKEPIVEQNCTRPDTSSQVTPTPAVDINANNETLPPAHLIYKGHKMVPNMLLELKNKQVRDLEAVVTSLQKKVNFLDNLIQLKDNRIEDLTRQLHSLRSKFQELTQSKLPDF